MRAVYNERIPSYLPTYLLYIRYLFPNPLKRYWVTEMQKESLHHYLDNKQNIRYVTYSTYYFLNRKYELLLSIKNGKCFFSNESNESFINEILITGKFDHLHSCLNWIFWKLYQDKSFFSLSFWHMRRAKYIFSFQLFHKW